MNKRAVWKRMVTLLAVAFAATGTYAYWETVGDFTWQYRIVGDTAEIYGSSENYGSSWSPAISPKPNGSVEMPETLGGLTVTSIGADAFRGCRNLTEIAIPNSVANIGTRAFYGCSGLTNVTIPDSVTSIGTNAFSGCSGLTSAILPDSVANIGTRAFYGCSGLTSAILPDSVTSIGPRAFYGCSGLRNVMVPQYVCASRLSFVFSSAYKSITNVVISGGVTSIGQRAFEDCRALTDVTIPDSATNIGQRAFEDCRALTSVTIGNGVTDIGQRAFYNCRALTDVTIPNSVTNIGVGAFRHCIGMIAFSVDSGNAFYSSVNGLLLSKDGTALIQGVNGDVTIPDGVTSIGYGAFYGYKSLTSVTIPGSVSEIRASAFAYCDGLASFSVAPDNHAYRVVSGLLLTRDGLMLISAPGNLTNVTIPDGVTSIGDYAFSSCSGLASVTIPDGVTGIGDFAFSGCSGLTDVTIPDSVTTIGDYAFNGCSGLTNVTFPSSLQGFRSDYLFTTDGYIASGGKLDTDFGSAQTVRGALYKRCALVGTVELKFGRMNERKETVRVSGAATLLVDGKMKRVSAKAVEMTLEENVALEEKLGGTLAFSAPLGEMKFSMEYDGLFFLQNDTYEMEGTLNSRALAIGGKLAKERMLFNVSLDSMPDFGADGALLEAALPEDVPIRVTNGTKWSFDKAAVLRYKRFKEDGRTRYELDGLADASKPNLSGLRLTYAAKTGQFKGSFKLYTTNAATTPEGRQPRLKKFTVNVAGFVVDGVGHGQATLKRPAGGPWAVKIR